MASLPEDVRRAAVSLLARGVARPHEVAELAGVSRQIVEYWGRVAGVDWERARLTRLAMAWRNGMRRRPRK